MTNSIKHIGLQVTEGDVKNFYEEILGFKLERTFVLTLENATDIFGIPLETKVLVGSCPEIELELFILNQPNSESFNHICFHTIRVSEIAAKAAEKGYKNFVRQNSETLFINDSNNNVFEIKQSI